MIRKFIQTFVLILVFATPSLAMDSEDEEDNAYCAKKINSLVEENAYPLSIGVPASIGTFAPPLLWLSGVLSIETTAGVSGLMEVGGLMWLSMFAGAAVGHVGYKGYRYWNNGSG